MPQYADIGKACKELLSGSAKSGAFSLDNKVTFSTKTASGVSFAASAVSKAAAATVDSSLKVAYSHGKYSADANFDPAGKIVTSLTLADIFPKAKLSATCTLPDPSTTKLGLEYAFPYLHVKSSAALSSAPLVDVTVSTGYNNVILGGEVSYDTAKSALGKYNVGVGYHAADFQVGAFLTDKASTAKFVYAHNVAAGQTVGAEVVKKLSGTGGTTFTLGVSKVLSSGALAKLKLDNAGVATILYETKLPKGETVAASIQIQVTDLSKPAKYGFAVNLF